MTDGPIRYYEALFKTPIYVGEFRRSTKGIVEGFWRLYSDDFYNIRALVPPRDEQDKIVAFLRTQDRQISCFIRDKRRLIELLNEQKQSIIHRAVTRGLDPNVRLRPSGIDWLGDVPEHWEIRRLKTIASIIMGQSPSSTDCNHDGNGFPFLQGCAEFGIVNPTPVQFCPFPPKKAPEGSILLSVRAPVGSMNVANKNYGIGRGLCAISRGSSLDHSFLFYSLVNSETQFKIASTGSTYDAVSTKDVGNLLITFPPLFEQEQISRFVTNETMSLEDAISKTKCEIDLIRELRERLISDVVTGKVDVRGWTPAPEDLAADDEELAVIGDEEEIPAEEDGDAND